MKAIHSLVYSGLKVKLTIRDFIKFSISVLSVILMTSFFSCEEQQNNPLTETHDTDETTPLPVKSLLHGTWKNIEMKPVVRFVTYDSISSIFSQKRDYGFNFRAELTSRAKIEQKQILWGVGDGTWEPWLWFRFNSSSYDTLFLAHDSLFQMDIMVFAKDTVVKNIDHWIEKLVPSKSERYTLSLDDLASVRSFAFADQNWLILSGSGRDDGKLFRIDITTDEIKEFSLPTAKAMDASGDYFWLVGNDYIEKRLIQDTTLVSYFDIREGIRNSQWIEGMAISDKAVLVMVQNPNEIVEFDWNGQVMRRVETYAGVDDMAFDNDTLWCTTRGSTVHKLNLQTGYANSTFSFRPLYIGQINGVAIADNFLACLGTKGNLLTIAYVPLN